MTSVSYKLMTIIAEYLKLQLKVMRDLTYSLLEKAFVKTFISYLSFIYDTARCITL